MASDHAFPTLETDRLLLRELEADDGGAMFAIFGNEAVARHHNIELMTHPQQGDRLVAHRRPLWADRRGIRWAIAWRSAPARAIGTCGFDFERHGHGAIELTYALHPDWWGCGCAREAIDASIACAFGGGLDLTIHRIEALTRPDNARSCALLASLHFTDEGVLRQYRHWRGVPADLRSFARLRSDVPVTPARQDAERAEVLEEAA